MHHGQSKPRNLTPPSSSGVTSGSGRGGGLNASSGGSSLPFSDGDTAGFGSRDARSATPAAPLGSAAAVGAADFFPVASPAPVLGKQQQPRQQEEPYQSHHVGCGSRPSLLPVPTSERDPCFGSRPPFGGFLRGRRKSPAGSSGVFGSRHR